VNYNLQVSVTLDGLMLVVRTSVKRRGADHEQLPSNRATMRFSCCRQNARDPAIAGLHMHSHRQIAVCGALEFNGLVVEAGTVHSYKSMCPQRMCARGS
jgi:hypothetical protein